MTVSVDLLLLTQHLMELEPSSLSPCLHHLWNRAGCLQLSL